MVSFLPRLIGIDTSYILREKAASGIVFYISGLIALLFAIVSLYSSYILLRNMGTTEIWSFSLALLYGFILTNLYIYTLCMISFHAIEIADKKSIVSANNRELLPSDDAACAIRIFLMFILILYISKPLELKIFESGISHQLLSGEGFNAGYSLLNKLEILHSQFPACWLVTLLTEFIFLFPLVWRSLSFKWGNYEYELNRYHASNELIIKSYLEFKQNYKSVLLSKYGDILNELGLNPEVAELYKDSPFNKTPTTDYHITKRNKSPEYNRWITGLPKITSNSIDKLIEN